MRNANWIIDTNVLFEGLTKTGGAPGLLIDAWLAGTLQGRLTLRLPESLHEQLAEQAHREGISLNQYIVYALTRQATMAYALHPNIRSRKRTPATGIYRVAETTWAGNGR